jgi:hypothetical protein
MDRLFRNFDFSLGATKDTQAAPKVRDSEYDFSSSSDSDVETSNLSEHRLNEYEMFLNGFYYFFLLQDPFIRNYLNLRYSPTMHQQEDILSDLKFFQDNCMLSWVQVMIKLEVFQSTAQFQWSNALSFCI